MAHTSPWQSTRCWIRLFSWSVLGATAYGLAVAHVPAAIGQPWSTCPDLASVVVVHLFEAPIALFNLLAAWYGLRRVERATARTYDVLLAALITINAVFFLFESLLVLDQLRRGAPAWEVWTTGSVAVILLGSLAMGIPIRVAIAKSIADGGAERETVRPARDAAELRGAADIRRSAVEAS